MTSSPPQQQLKHKPMIRDLYESIHDSMLYMKETRQCIPIPLSEISTNPNIRKIIVLNQFITKSTDRKKELISKRKGTQLYRITEKGLDYIKRYQNIRELFNTGI
ncbi:MAG: hypothetical protein L0H53_00555 [Candidatus Nitrosocosmicus sp.]|nr:hypothetical protein [Candidatus Nitrosocosmicus sp.]MDN5866027.1 hypothetical protein [Candidatus Nitrosocosmicus sp.]